MGEISTFGTFTMARLGIYVSQHALNVTGNNISNINTEGYTRQELSQTSMFYGTGDRYQSTFDIRGNGGVLATGIDQIRDKYLDIRYRNEMTRVGTMQESLNGYERLSDIFDEVAAGEDGEGVLEARFNDFIQQMEMLGRDESAGKDDIDFIVRDAAEALTIQFNDYANQLESLREFESAGLRDDVSEVNTILTKIRNLNESIRRAQIFGNSALTQRDERNLLIDSLSEKIGINVTYESESLGDGVEVERLRIATSGEPSRTLVNGVYAAQLSIRDEEGYGFNLSTLVDAKGNEDPSAPNNLAVFVPSEVTEVADAQATRFTKETADGMAAYLNANSDFTKVDGKKYTFSVQATTGANGEPDGKYMVLRQDVTDPANPGTPKALEVETKPLYDSDLTLTALGSDVNAAKEKAVWDSKAEALSVAAYLNSDEKYARSGDTKYWYSVHTYENEAGEEEGYAILRHDISALKTTVEEAAEGNATLYTKKEAQKMVEELNADTYYTSAGGKTYQFSAEAVKDTDGQETEKYRILRQDVTDPANPGEAKALKITTPTEAEKESQPYEAIRVSGKRLYEMPGKVSALGGNWNNAKSQVTFFATKDEAGAMAAYLNANEEYTDGGDTTYYYHVYEAPDNTGRYLIHKHDKNAESDGTSHFEYTKIELVRQIKLTDTELTGGLQARRELLTEKGPYATAEDLAEDKDAAVKRGIPYYQKALDTLANTFARLMNEANTLNDSDIYQTKDGKFVDADGNVLADQADKTQYVIKSEFAKYFKQDADGNFLNADGDVAADPTEYVHAEAYEKYFGGTLFSNRGDGNDADNPEITAANISISRSWAEGKMHVLPTKDPDADIKSRAQDNTAHIISMLGSRHSFTVSSGGQGETFFVGTFQELLTDTIAGTLAKDQNVTGTMLKNYTAAADELATDRDSVMGVDLNDEAMNMMQYQKAYAAACRLMTTYDDMIDKLINGTAV